MWGSQVSQGSLAAPKAYLSSGISKEMPTFIIRTLASTIPNKIKKNIIIITIILKNSNNNNCRNNISNNNTKKP